MSSCSGGFAANAREPSIGVSTPRWLVGAPPTRGRGPNEPQDRLNDELTEESPTRRPGQHDDILHGEVASVIRQDRGTVRPGSACDQRVRRMERPSEACTSLLIAAGTRGSLPIRDQESEALEKEPRRLSLF